MNGEMCIDSLEKLNVVKMSFLPKLTYRFSALPITIPTVFL